MEKRELWVQALTAVGGKQLDYPAAATQTPAADAAVPADVLVALFFYSCREGDAGAVEGLLTRQAGLDVNAKDDDGWTGLHHACRKGHEGVVRLLLADPRVDRNAKNPRELTALHIACAVGHSAVVGLLVADPKVDVNAKIKGAYTAFHFACSNGHLAVAQVLLDNRRVDFDTVLSDGQTGIDIARSQGHHDIVRAIEAARSRRAAWQTAEQLFKDLDMAQPGKLAPAVPGRPRSRAQSSASDVTIVGGGGDAKPAPARSKTSYWVDEADVAYERSACLGKGGFGAVYRGKYLGLTDVAVKVALDSYSTDEANALLEAEVKVWADLPAHENVVPLLGYRTAPTLLITKLYHGGSMKSFLAGRNWEPALALHLLAEAAVGVTFLHSKGVIHSDLKAENVLVEDGGSRPVAKIADFGLAKVRTRIEDSRGGKAYQYHGLAGATVRYAPPEFFDDEPLRKPSDVWTFGMMCYQVLSRGKDPYDQLSSASAVIVSTFAAGQSNADGHRS
ncbi:kinase-like domain-containing protein [Hyaloraphidium curvatum]|nr:kinase-like domain-containing protein [Hyaloraphidium curvatum]